jgi:hypothetical protein
VQSWELHNVLLVLAYYKGQHAKRLTADWTNEPLLQAEFVASVR